MDGKARRGGGSMHIPCTGAVFRARDGPRTDPAAALRFNDPVTDEECQRVSRCGVCSRHQRQYFFNSRRSLVLVLFFVVT
jgi:hypothetical protein